ncbi:MAG: S9 family peptidase [Xanthomonadaceae bacterium]|nr:S9 family peptidase [Xanthomonadaceae bacterium]
MADRKPHLGRPPVRAFRGRPPPDRVRNAQSRRRPVAALSAGQAGRIRAGHSLPGLPACLRGTDLAHGIQPLGATPPDRSIHGAPRLCGFFRRQPRHRRPGCRFPGTGLSQSVAVAPVTDWALYDTHYTERYLGMPRQADGRPTEAYSRANVINYAGALSDPLLLIHGMADDNVLFTHSTLLMEKLQADAIDFEMMTYPGEKHAISGQGQRLHVYRQIDRFMQRHLKD